MQHKRLYRIINHTSAIYWLLSGYPEIHTAWRKPSIHPTTQLLSAAGARKEYQSTPFMQLEGNQPHQQLLPVYTTHAKQKLWAPNLSLPSTMVHPDMYNHSINRTPCQTDLYVLPFFITFMNIPSPCFYLSFVIHFFTLYHPLIISSQHWCWCIIIFT